MSVGTYVVYWSNPGAPVDTTIGVVEAVNGQLVKVLWSDGFSDWYGVAALTKV